ncbi:MAG: hypothetical protein J0L99_09190 [Chitinophagales bacterium]|nr:hypothetical protein [Chitinophagales bacterium]
MAYNSKNGKIYLDPSYGTPQPGTLFSSKNLYEDASIAGFGTILKYKETAVGQEIKILWLSEQNTIASQLNFFVDIRP